jgi:cbb3-type cytochrome oxidase subunit 1
VGIKLIKIGIVYLLIGMGMGVYMGATKDFSLRPVHAHVNLLGWTLLGLSGLIFHVFPQLEQSVLAKIYFWLYNLSVPLTLVSLFLFVNGNTAIDPVLGLGSVLITVSAACFAWLLLTRLPSTK